MKSILTKYQKQTFSKQIQYDGMPCKMFVTLRYDDECGNGHNTFSITGKIKDHKNKIRCEGCIHNEIATYFPEFKHLIKWHLCNSESPLYYIENTLYHASNSKSSKYKAGEPNKWAKVLQFENSHLTFKFKNDFMVFLENHKDYKNFKAESRNFIKTKPTDYDFKPHYTFENYSTDWYSCPFDNEQKAEEFAQELNTHNWEIKTIVTGYQEGKPRDFVVARKSAIWEDATEEQLSLPSEELKKLLLKRLPKLMKAFRKDIESLGFIY